MARPRTPNPYRSAEEFEAALKEAKSLDGLARSLGHSSGLLRRWASELGASTRSGLTGRVSSCPFSTKAELETALEKSGNFAVFCHEQGVSDKTARRWMHSLGIGAPPNHRKKPAGWVLERLDDHEFTALLSLFGVDRLAVVLELSTLSVRREAAKRGISIGEHTLNKSPKVQMLERRIKELERRDASLNELSETLRQVAGVVSLEPPPKLPSAKVRRDRSRVDVVLHVSDLQYGMIVDPDEVPGGAYSPEIFEDRLARYLEAVDALIENTAAANPIGTVWIAQGGDFVEGEDVFKGQSAWHLAMDAGEQVVRLSRLWGAALQHIAARARQFKAQQIAVVSVVGNHGQHGGRSAGAVPPSLNYDYLCYEMTRVMLSGQPDNGGVSFYDSEARRAVYFATCGGVVLLTHGEQDKGGGLIGVPVVTGMRNSLTAMVSTGVRPVLHLSGHFHRPAQISLSSDMTRIWSGPWVGQTNLSLGRGGASSPSQHMLVMHPKHGLVAQHRIRLSDAVESPVEILEMPT